MVSYVPVTYTCASVAHVRPFARLQSRSWNYIVTLRVCTRAHATLLRDFCGSVRAVINDDSDAAHGSTLDQLVRTSRGQRSRGRNDLSINVLGLFTGHGSPAWISGGAGARPPDSRFSSLSTSSLRRKCLCSRGGSSRFPLFGGQGFHRDRVCKVLARDREERDAAKGTEVEFVIY